MTLLAEPRACPTFAKTMKRAFLCLLATAACTTSSSRFPGFTDAGGGLTPDLDGGTIPALGSSRGVDGSGASDDAAPAAPPSAHVRFADWSPDAPPSGFSFCLSPQGMQAWLGPFLPKGLAFPGTSAYSDVPPGTYDAEIVAASSGDCSTGVLPMSTPLPSLDDGMYATVAAIGDVTPPFAEQSMRLAAFVDDDVGTAGSALLRMIDAAPSFRYVNVGTGTMAKGDFRLLFASAGFGTPATIATGGQMFDPNGYAQLMPMSNVDLSVQPISAGGRDAATASNVSLAAGTVATLVIIGGKMGGPPPQIMMCDDAAAARGAASACNVFSH
jgi:hypothetical protein